MATLRSATESVARRAAPLAALAGATAAALGTALIAVSGRDLALSFAAFFFIVAGKKKRNERFFFFGNLSALPW